MNLIRGLNGKGKKSKTEFTELAETPKPSWTFWGQQLNPSNEQ